MIQEVRYVESDVLRSRIHRKNVVQKLVIVSSFDLSFDEREIYKHSVIVQNVATNPKNDLPIVPVKFRTRGVVIQIQSMSGRNFEFCFY